MAIKKDQKKITETKESKLLYKTKSAWESTDDKKAFEFSKKYINFLTKAKTDFQTQDEVLKLLKRKGFKEEKEFKTIKENDKIIFTFKEKTMLVVKVGKKPEQIKLIGVHIDSPRLDLKPKPLYEDSDFAMLKTHYYGGIKKYHWVNTPLALHGNIYLKNGRKINISIGEKEDEPKFIIPDLLVHLSRQQMEKKGNKIIEGEELNIIVGNIPLKKTKENEKIKLAVLEILNKKFGLIEEDFIGGDLEFVPAGKPVEIGFDKSLIAAYGHDDKSCVYNAIEAIINSKKSESTQIILLVDKEEIGSEGNTGAQSNILRNYIKKYLLKLKNKNLDVDLILENAKAVIGDVGSGLNPNYKEVHEINNAPIIGRGPIFYKYKGLGGKYYTTEASSEFTHYIKQLFSKAKIPWQTGEGGKIDLAGGGTIASHFARYGMDVIDVGPGVLAMHSTNELISKVDLYNTYLFYKTFLEEK